MSGTHVQAPLQTVTPAFREPLCILSHGVAEHGKGSQGRPWSFGRARSRRESPNCGSLSGPAPAGGSPLSGASGPYSFYQAFAQMHDLSSLGITTPRTISLSFCQKSVARRHFPSGRFSIASRRTSSVRPQIWPRPVCGGDTKKKLMSRPKREIVPSVVILSDRRIPSPPNLSDSFRLGGMLEHIRPEPRQLFAGASICLSLPPSH